jgi:putative ABC transport system permease protein
MANALFGRKRFEREMNEELRLHIEMQTQAYIDQGMDPTEAKRKARLEFGNIDSVCEEARETRALAWLDNIRRDIRVAIRGLIREPWFTIVCVFILALAIGANTAIFSLINATFLRSIPYKDPARIMQVWESSNRYDRNNFCYPNFKDLRERQTCFSEMAMSIDWTARMQAGRKTERIQCVFVSADFFKLLGVTPTVGRDFSSKDDTAGSPLVAILTAGAWRDKFGADPEIVGKTVMLDDRTVQIVGVLPDKFRHYHEAHIFVPIAPIASSMYLDSRESRWGNTVIGRLASGVGENEARTQIRSIASTLANTYPQNEGISFDLEPFQNALGRNSHERLLFLYGAVALFLLIACVNLSNMFLARGMSRTKEMAICAALGATRRQLVRQLLIESLVVSSIGGIFGIVVAWQASHFVAQLIPWEIRYTLENGSAFDARVCVFAILLTFTTGILFGLAPAIRLSHTHPSAAMKEEGDTPGRRGRWSGSDILIVAQVSLVVMLLVASGLLIRSLQRVLDAPTGIVPENLVTFQISGPSQSSFQKNPNGFVSFYLNTINHIEQIPGVESATFCSSLPYSWNDSQMNIYPLDRPVPEHSKLQSGYVHISSTDVFKTLGVTLLKGRLFDDNTPVFNYPDFNGDTQSFTRVLGGLVVDCVINKRMAEKFWPGEDPIGKRLHIGPPNIELGTAIVVGVVGNTLASGAERGEVSEFYLPFRNIPIPNSLFFAARVRGDPETAMRTLRDDLTNYLPNNPVDNMHLMTERMDWSVSDRKFTMMMLGSFALAALLLAAAGIYGVLSFITTRRTREIAIRLTLGASQGEILTDVLRHGAILLVAGLGIGLVASFFLQRFIRAQLYGVSGTDPASFIAGAIVLMAVGLLACFIPAWRASRVDPMGILRSN